MLTKYLKKLARLRHGWVCVFLILIAGCYPSALQQDYGQAWSYNLSVQVLNPNAGQTDTPAAGLPPQAGKNVMESYNKTFEKKEEAKVPTASVVQIGGQSQ